MRLSSGTYTLAHSRALTHACTQAHALCLVKSTDLEPGFESPLSINFLDCVGQVLQG